ncbi:MAG: hypothetical protein UU72_C0008G0031 [candidate division WWE3 bacterium GW2011_GWB1_41_6]|uniref:LytR/CpsA/Psr regulator C-terminal domain-containing protein n=1 Tax=candidate division WWE3 bacterium GW2011_GWB1_41_6 TaxID=1619112 RepID=A0A0G0WWD9_UNCKA|nr:MAG: hypothetical protein UU72_C0008G0031 [candidate division WWE3 bacterium GW2011_GWB1_41_6]
MQNLTLSLNENIVKLTLTVESEFRTASAKVDMNVANDTEVLDTQAFSEVVLGLIKELSIKANKKPVLNYLVEPADIMVRFVTVNKRTGDSDENILEDIKSKLDNHNLDDIYFAYQKIAPFVYQFVGIKKDKMEKILEVSNNLGLSLQSVIPWILLLPKLVGTSEPCIFIYNTNGNQVVALSELNGIYFSETFDTAKTPKELEKLVSDLSVYKRAAPITRIYTVSSESFSLDPNYTVIPLLPSGEEFKDIKDFEMHALLNKLMEEDPSLLVSQLNLLNLLPLPVEQKKNASLVLVGAGSVAALMIFLGLIYTNLIRDNSTNQPVVTPENSEVLSETVEATPSNEIVGEVEELKKEDLVIRIENGAGVPGVAAQTQEFVEGKGYKVAEIGNAEETGRDNTLLKIKPSKAAYKEMLLADLGDEFELVVEENLDENSEHDLLIVVGLN